MELGRAERYVVEQESNGIVIRMRQGFRGLFFVVLGAGVLGATWWFGPYGPAHQQDIDGVFYWLWSGMWTLLTTMGLLAAFYTEDWTITHAEVAVRKGFRSGGRVRRVARGPVLALVVERAQREGQKTPIFPWRIHVLDAAGARTRLKLDLQRREAVDDLLRALRLATTVQVEDASRAGHESYS